MSRLDRFCLALASFLFLLLMLVGRALPTALFWVLLGGTSAALVFLLIRLLTARSKIREVQRPSLEQLGKLAESLGSGAEILLDIQSADWSSVSRRLATSEPVVVEQVLVTLVVLDRLEDARRLAAEARRIIGDHGMFYLHEGIVAQLEGDLDGAAERYRLATSFPEVAISAWLNLASVQSAGWEFGAAAESASRALDLEPDEVRTLAIATWVSRLADQSRVGELPHQESPTGSRADTKDQKIEDDKWVQRFVSHADVAHRSARSYQDHQQQRAAEQLLLRALEFDPWHLLAAVDLVLLVGEKGEDERALELVRGFLGQIPGADCLYFNQGSILLRLGRIEEAVGAFEACLDYRADWLEPRINLVSTLVSLGRHEDAKGHIEQLRQLGLDESVLSRLQTPH